ncbi:pentapeptide repeat-containing protein [Lentzea sp. NPDC059081]|uniref:pentapeptide repeat-containing protein n=1 Tax=Lentzea sp. NPDC059081 TaxID=3346719 RepID=UPI0036BFE5F6
MGLGAAGLGVVVLFGLGVVLFVPQLIHPSPRVDLASLTELQARFVLQREAAQTALRSSLLQFFGGLLLAAGGAVTWYQVRVNKDGQITDRFSRAVEYLANGHVDVRIGGLYVLERIAKDSPQDRRFVQFTIGSFLRNRSPWPEQPMKPVDHDLPWLRLRAPDVQVAIEILAQTPANRDAPPLLLSRADLRSVHLEGRHLSGAFIRRSNLARARLQGTRMDGCDLRATDLREANLVGAGLRKASLRSAHLEGADLRDADLSETDLRGAHADTTTRWPPALTPEVLHERGVVGHAATAQ